MRKSVRQFKETLDLQQGKLQRLRSNPYLPAGILLTCLSLVACLHVWQRVHVLRLVSEVEHLTADQQLIQDETRKLQAEVATLSMASRIQTYAADTLGMRPIQTERPLLIERRDSVIRRGNDFQTMLASLQRMVDYLPVLSEATVTAGEPPAPQFDSTTTAEGQP